MAIGAVLLGFMASVMFAGYALLYTGLGLGMALAIYSMAGSSTLMTLTLVSGIRSGDLR